MRAIVGCLVVMTVIGILVATSASQEVSKVVIAGTVVAFLTAMNYFRNRGRAARLADLARQWRGRVVPGRLLGHPRLDISVDGEPARVTFQYSDRSRWTKVHVNWPCPNRLRITPEGFAKRVRSLFEDLEQKEQLIQLLDGVRDAEGVRIFIGAETRLFSLSGSAVIAAPYMTGAQKVVGAIGVIGPARLNYARIIPLVDYTARVLGQVMNA